MSSLLSRLRSALFGVAPLQQSFALAGRMALLGSAAFFQSGMTLPTPFQSVSIGETHTAMPSIEYGRAGVVGTLFNGGDLSCGGKYDSAAPVVFHPTLPCGTEVKVYNPETQLQAIAKVANNKVMFRKGYGRIADLSVATANAVGLDPDATRAQPVIIQPLGQSLTDSLQNMITSLPATLPSMPSIPSVADDTLTVLTRNLVAECGNCGTLGMLAVARVTVNRAEMGFMGASSIRQVVYQPYQFSWVHQGKTPSRSYKYWNDAEDLAEATLTDQVSGAGLGLFYRMGWKADHFYATHINAPAWANRMERIKFSSNVEKQDLRHRYFASGKYDVSEVESSFTLASR